MSSERLLADDPAEVFQRRWDRGWLLLPYGIVGLAAAIALLDTAAPATERGTWAAACAALLAWHGWFVTAHPGWPGRRVVPMLVYVAGLVAVGALLAAAHPAFVIVLVGGYPMSFVALPGRWAYAGVAATVVGLAVVIGGPQPTPLLVVQLAPAALAAVGVGWAVRRLEAEARRRDEVNAELRCAYRDLHELAGRNEALQARVLVRERAGAVAAERARLARELHDTLAQALVGVTTRLEVAAELLGPAHAVRPHIDGAAALARSGLTEARRSVEGLRPEPLERLPLAAAVAEVVADWSARTDSDARLEHDGDPVPVGEETESALLRAVQECLANVERHAGARRVTVTVSFLDDLVALDVHDDGVGFTPDAVVAPGMHGGFGLRAMRERVAEVGGSVSVESAPGSGTTVNVTVPAGAR